MLDKYPNLWVLGVHIYLPLLTLLYLVLFAIGLLYPLNPLPFWNNYEDVFENLTVTMILPTILLTVMFVIRQVKYNSKRVHLSLPHKNSFLVFLYFIGIFFLITASPFVANFGANVRSHMALDVNEFEKDVKALEKGFAHIFLEKQFIDVYRKDFNPKIHFNEDLDDNNDEYYDGYNRNYHTVRYKLNETRDSLILYRSFVRYYYRNDLDTISLEQAYKEIDDFIRVSSKYEGQTTTTNAQEIVRRNLASTKYFLKDEASNGPAFDYLESYSRFDNNIEFHDNLSENNSIFFVVEWKFWKIYFLLALSLAIVLLILCSVKITEFGWGMLVVALLPTVYGIFMALGVFTLQHSGNNTIEKYGLVLTLVFLGLTMFIVFSNNFKPALKRAFAIALHIYAPLVVVAVITFYEEIADCCFRNPAYRYDCDCTYLLTRSEFEDLLLLSSVVTAVVVTYLFGRYYKKQYINPQKA